MPSSHRKTKRTSPYLIVLVGIGLILALYIIARVGSQGRVLGSVSVADIELGGSDEETARQALVDLEERLANLPAPVTIEGTTVQVIPIQTGFDLDEDSLVSAALSVGRSANPVSDFFHWITHIAATTDIAPTGSIDAEALDSTMAALDVSIVGSPPFDGGIEVVDGQVVATYPREGRRISRPVAAERLLDQFLSLDRAGADLPVEDSQPELTVGDVDRAAAEANIMISAPVILESESATVTFSAADLAAAFVAETRLDPTRIELGFDPVVVEQRLAGIREEFEAAPVDARYEISGYEVSIIPGRNGTRLDGDEAAAVLTEASVSSGRRAPLPLEEGAEPDVTTNELETLDVKHLVSQFTTYYDCCAPRVTNIQLIADAVDGAIIAPGQSFSLNDHVGQRTADKGYLDAGTIVAGEIVDTVGGGVSQFATTFYNAVFWGGYEDVEHKPHSFYFSRYPEGIEATISWPQPNLVFRNNDDSGVLIKTSYSDTSITVSFYGNNDGRILTGEQSGGNLGVGVVAEGGPDAKQIRGDRSDRFDETEPPEPLYRGNPEFGIDEQEVVQSAATGWSLTVTRTITVNGETTTQEWPVRYLAKQEIIEVHPCKVPDGAVPCPTTTTTTSPTTLPPSTSTPPTTTPPPTTPPTTEPTETTPPTTGG